jgi:hypothetical protein
MNESERIDNAAGLALVDRLAAGELSGPARRDLFTWLDGDLARWRLCALTLLETRELEQALADWSAEVPGLPPTSNVPGVHRVATVRRGWAGRVLLATSLMIAFGLGVVVDGVRVPPARRDVQARSDPGTRGLPVEEFVADQARDDAIVSPAPQPNNHRGTRAVAESRVPGETENMLPPYVRSQWEKQGYRVESSHQMLAVALPDGRHVKVPVDQMQFKFVGQRLY